MPPFSSHLKKKFTKEEDRKLVESVRIHGDNNWNKIAEVFFNRSPRQLKERWTNYLNPAVNKNEWTEEEEELLLEKLSEFGKRWREISKYFNGRTDVQLKTRYRMIKRRQQTNDNNFIQNNNTKSTEKQQTNKQFENKYDNKVIKIFDQHSSESEPFDINWPLEEAIFNLF